MAITLNKIGNNANERTLEIYGKSSDIKPTDFVENVPICNGSVFIEIDTGKGFLFDEQNRIWREV